MSININALLLEQCKVVLGLGAIVPSSSTPDYVSMKGFSRCLILIFVKNATTVTGSAITVKQATNVAAGSEKAVSFTTAYRTLNAGPAGATDTMSAFTVSS